jgi:diketogulonate reductase-like aldo/keto reductase
MIERHIPSTNEKLPVIGLGTWIQFDVGNSPEEQQLLKEVLTQMIVHKGKMIDSSPMYGKSEKVVGDLTQALKLSDKFFYATKVWTTGEQNGILQMEDSFRKMKREQMDLMQIHNLVDWQTHLKTLRRWKAEGKIRYIGITHYSNSAHDDLERIIKKEEIDFVQFNYSILNPHAEKSLLPTALDQKVAVIINIPFESGSVFKQITHKPLPEWAKEQDIHSWTDYFLKYIIAHPAVTCVIPGTSNPKHLIDNMKAGTGKLPDEKLKQQMVHYLKSL